MTYSWPDFAVPLDGGLLICSGGAMSSLSGIMVGAIVDLVNANTACQLIAMGNGFGSGPLILAVQCSDNTTSGSFTDPTSGLAQLPGAFSSGGQLIIGSGPGAFVGLFNSGVSGQGILSGWMGASLFQRPQRYARVLVASGFYDGTLVAGFLSNLRTTGSGGGFSASPLSGNTAVNV